MSDEVIDIGVSESERTKVDDITFEIMPKPGRVKSDGCPILGIPLVVDVDGDGRGVVEAKAVISVT